MNAISLKFANAFNMAKAENFTRKYNTAFTLFLTFSIALILFAGFAGASTDATFSNWTNWIVEKIEGSGGYLVAILGLVGVLWGILSGNIKMLGGVLLIILLATLGPGVLATLFSATF